MIVTGRKALRVLVASTLIPIAMLGSSQDHFFESAGVSIRFEDTGRGTPVVIIHGWSGTAKMWAEAGVEQSRLGKFRLITIGCRGHGRGDKPHDTASYGTEMVTDLVRLLDELDVRRAHIVGYSMSS